jgi:hypothetical protein
MGPRYVRLLEEIDRRGASGRRVRASGSAIAPASTASVRWSGCRASCHSTTPGAHRRRPELTDEARDLIRLYRAWRTELSAPATGSSGASGVMADVAEPFRRDDRRLRHRCGGGRATQRLHGGVAHPGLLRSPAARAQREPGVRLLPAAPGRRGFVVNASPRPAQPGGAWDPPGRDQDKLAGIPGIPPFRLPFTGASPGLTAAHDRFRAGDHDHPPAPSPVSSSRPMPSFILIPAT